ncbi:MAG: DNA polymerase III subunit gamma/tau [Alphaproteobacteria bacterium]|nr:DNA polymerase III subunit gamma/tau [Alphaproteobacteria bacterium]
MKGHLLNELFPTPPEPAEYRVLARKYRPTTFSELIGQEALVRTLSNAIKKDRLAHAFLLTGIRGVGKTTTARIIAKALNCIGPDGNGGITTEPCGECENCKAITADRHVDVLEMDAASRTGVNDIREIIETVRYRPTNARFKVYIIDEVHMLSTQAFNALLKTLEEPPPMVKFIFATTELRKIPVTILSRCQRFDLRRVDSALLASHLAQVAEKENVPVEADALPLIAAAAEGSVRDSLSLLDQAIAHGEGKVTAAQVQEMLGLADRTAVFTLFEALLSGKPQDALAQMGTLYEIGADPVMVLQDLLEITHLVSRMKVVPALKEDKSLPEVDRTRGAALSERLPVSVLARCWQMLLKGVEETRRAPQPVMAAEMVLIRIAHAADLPTPAEVIRGGAGSDTPAAKPRPSVAPAPMMGGGGGGGGGRKTATAPALQEEPVDMPMAYLQPEFVQDTLPSVQSIEDVAELFNQHRAIVLYTEIRNHFRVVSFTEGKIEIEATPELPGDLAFQVSRRLSEWTGRRWMVSPVAREGAETLRVREENAKARMMDEVTAHPLVQEVLTQFPGATVTGIRKTETEY